MIEPGVKVVTTEDYYKRTGRVVHGETIKLYCDVPPDTVGVIWEKQEGNIDIRMAGLKVLMSASDIEAI